MKNNVMISIHPKWCELIANGKKTIEVRKCIPKLETPFKCYIYCTKGSNDWLYKTSDLSTGYQTQYRLFGRTMGIETYLNGKVIGEFVCDYITRARADTLARAYANNNPAETCMSDYELCNYSSIRKPVYFWHISELQIYDIPRELGEYWGRAQCSYLHTPDCWSCLAPCQEIDGIIYRPLKKSPQSWRYVKTDIDLVTELFEAEQ